MNVNEKNRNVLSLLCMSMQYTYITQCNNIPYSDIICKMTTISYNCFTHCVQARHKETIYVKAKKKQL